jgi:cell wall-associated NlpC family hydrolase
MRVTDLIGVPFIDGGRGPEGYDCWGLCLEVFRRCGVALPDYKLCCYDSPGFFSLFQGALSQWTRCDPPAVPAVVALKLNFPAVNHAGVYVGEGKFLHTRDKTGVVIECLNAPQWRHRIEGFYVPLKKAYGVDS